MAVNNLMVGEQKAPPPPSENRVKSVTSHLIVPDLINLSVKVSASSYLIQSKRTSQYLKIKQKDLVQCASPYTFSETPGIYI